MSRVEKKLKNNVNGYEERAWGTRLPFLRRILLSAS